MMLNEDKRSAWSMNKSKDRVVCVHMRLDTPLKATNLPFNIAHCATLLSKQQN